MKNVYTKCVQRQGVSKKGNRTFDVFVVNSIISTDEDPSLRIESSAIINLRGVSTKLNKYNSKVVFLSLCGRC